MWRSSKDVFWKAQLLGRQIVHQSNRNASGASSAVGRAAKAVIWTTGALGAGTGGTIAYAWYDPDFRRTIESNVPQAKDFFQNLFGDPVYTPKPLPSPSEILNLSKPVVGESTSIRQSEKSKPTDGTPSTSKTKQSDIDITPKSTTVETVKSAGLDTPNPPNVQQKDTTPPPKPQRPEPVDISETKPKQSVASGPETRANLQTEFDEELKKQLRRQAEIHSEHLVDVLRAQKAQLESQFQRDLDSALIKERDIFNKELTTSISRLHAIESALEGRAEQDIENRRAKELWLACQHLRKSVVHGDHAARRKPLVKEVAAIKEAGAADPFVKTLLGSISGAAVKEGVYTQDDLVDRFKRVKKICRRTALIGENGGTLFQYFLSYMQSFFLFDRIKPDPKDLQEVDPSNIDTLGILWRASHLVDQSNLEDAIKLMLLLKGEPARLASDWIKDARTHLETRRTAELLLAHASAVSMRTIY